LKGDPVQETRDDRGAAVGLAPPAAPARAADPQPDTAHALALALTAEACQANGASGDDTRIAGELNGRLADSPRLGGSVTAYQISCARAIVAQVRARKLNERAA
jgi:hypothetical protein